MSNINKKVDLIYLYQWIELGLNENNHLGFMTKYESKHLIVTDFVTI